jgi:hypothetical protein
LPPQPKIKPLFIKVMPPGQDPSITKPDKLVTVEYTYTSALTVTVAGRVPFHPLASAQVLKFRFVWLVLIVPANAFAFP